MMPALRNEVKNNIKNALILKGEKRPDKRTEELYSNAVAVDTPIASSRAILRQYGAWPGMGSFLSLKLWERPSQFQTA